MVGMGIRNNGGNANSCKKGTPHSLLCGRRQAQEEKARPSSTCNPCLDDVVPAHPVANATHIACYVGHPSRTFKILFYYPKATSPVPD